jgi:hypothetical protein
MKYKGKYCIQYTVCSSYAAYGQSVCRGCLLLNF